ncbi:hypothetical protein B9Z19DRAFT_1138262 [Tuber borchii]|uniref:Reverse transcriptase domain-containing protein n=1 Tax=Tuber borchii TaxID=42251 RepID=A0A2T6ZA20_TUBBO|nr:hypothetical protein B9Z19DRAFT_1138262 [Tuber borchii]
MSFMNQLPYDIDIGRSYDEDNHNMDDTDNARSSDSNTENDTDDTYDLHSYYRNNKDYMKGPQYPHGGMPPVPIFYSIGNLLEEVLLFTMDFAVNQQTNGLFLYRIHDDFWLWDKDQERVSTTWEVISQFTKLVGLEFNEEKTGSSCIGDGTLHLSLPKGNIK